MKEIYKEILDMLKRHCSTRTFLIFIIWIATCGALAGMAIFNKGYDEAISKYYFIATNISGIFGAVLFFISIAFDLMKADRRNKRIIKQKDDKITEISEELLALKQLQKLDQEIQSSPVVEVNGKKTIIDPMIRAENIQKEKDKIYERHLNNRFKTSP